ncbi:MAG: PaRep2b protein [Pyrobaculum sp.]|uniref:PaRep2b protein n=1 Tax=Pyrobaculum sp. TaxID=2004705 RepID=UPI003169665C
MNSASAILYLEARLLGPGKCAGRLAEVLRALGARVEARPCGREWCVSMGADQIAEVRHEGWVAAVAEFLRRKAAEAKDEEERRIIERALREVLYGTNRIWLYGVPLRVSYRPDTNALVIRYSPEREEELRRAYEALRERLGGGVTAGRRHVALKVPEALRELARRAAQGDQEAERFLRELRRYAEAHDKARGLAEGGLLKKLEEVLKPHAAVEGLVVDVGGVQTVVKVRAEVGVGAGAGSTPAAD